MSNRKTDWMDGLDARQVRFVREYVRDLKPMEAALRAGYSKKSASGQAHKLRNTPKIAAAIKFLLEDIFGVTKASIVNRLRAHLTVDYADYYEPNPSVPGSYRLKQTHQLNPDQMAAIEHINYDTGELRLHSQQAAAELLLKAFGMGKTNISIDLNGGGEPEPQVDHRARLMQRLQAMEPRQIEHKPAMLAPVSEPMPAARAATPVPAAEHGQRDSEPTPAPQPATPSIHELILTPIEELDQMHEWGMQRRNQILRGY